MKKLLLFCCFIFMILLYSPVQATTISYTDNMTEDGFNIYYQLDVTELGGNDYSATFKIDGSGSTTDAWYIGGINFKFFEGSFTPTLTSLTPDYGNWIIAIPGTTQIGGWSVMDNRGGFHHEHAGLVIDNVVDPLLVNVPPFFEFSFTFSGDGFIYQDLMPFQVAYWDGYAGGSSNVHFGQLSATLGTPVPEPGMVILLGIGLLGLAFYNRKRLLN